MSLPPGAEPRVVCGRCRRPEGVCYCRHITPVPTVTRVVLLQHPRERDVPIGTAHMASLCLPNAELHVGVHWSGSAALARALSDPTRPAALLYPGAGAIDVTRHPPSSPVTLIVVDGTWSQTRKVVRENPELAALPRYAFTPATPSEYRIRKEPEDAYVSTIEALVHVLGALEGDPDRARALLRPFRAMVEAQLAYAAEMRHGRGRSKRPPRPPSPRVPAWLGERAGDLLCVVGEANAWPYRDGQRGTEYPDELVHWVAHRLGTGETLDLVVAPRNALSSRTPANIELGPEVIQAGEALDAFLAQWRGFVRDTDVLCGWGHYSTGLLASVGGHLPSTPLDVRQLARDVERRKVGTVEEYQQSLGAAPSPPLGRGRAGTRLARLTDIVRSLVARAGVVGGTAA
jgi:DTW domain-containing protein YfiP